MDHGPRDPIERPKQGDTAPQQPHTPLPPIRGDRAGAVARRYYLLEFLAILFTLFVGELLFRAMTGWVLEGDITIPGVLATAFTDVGYCLLVWVLLTRRGPFDWRLPRTAVKWAQEFGWALLLILAIFGCTLVLVLIISPLGLQCSAAPWANGTGRSTAVAALGLIFPIVGLGEELLFRVYTQTRLTQILGGRKVLPVLLGASLFAAAHAYPWTGTVVVGIIGLVLGVSYQANGKIPRLVIAHTLWNLMVLLLPLVPDGIGPDTVLG